jgi:hypothetical protein
LKEAYLPALSNRQLLISLEGNFIITQPHHPVIETTAYSVEQTSRQTWPPTETLFSILFSFPNDAKTCSQYGEGTVA